MVHRTTRYDSGQSVREVGTTLLSTECVRFVEAFWLMANCAETRHVEPGDFQASSLDATKHVQGKGAAVEGGADRGLSAHGIRLTQVQHVRLKEVLYAEEGTALNAKNSSGSRSMSSSKRHRMKMMRRFLT